MAVAWHNRAELRTAGVQELREHRAAGTLARRRDAPVRVGPDGRARGGFHVCLTARGLAEARNVPVARVLADDGVRWLDETARIWGISPVVGGLIDRCFEQVPAAEAADFAVAAAEAIPVGGDLGRVPARWVVDLLADHEGGGAHGVLGRTDPGSPQHSAVARVLRLYTRKLAGETIAVEEWRAAALAAQEASDQANAATPAGPPTTATATAYAAAAAYAPDALPVEVRAAAWRASVDLPDQTAAAAYQAVHLESEALAQAAHYAVNTVEAVADAAFRRAFAPIEDAANRARAAERAGRVPEQADADAAARARAAADRGVAAVTDYHRWQARLLVRHLAQAPTARP
ncbi:hypothetical protein V5P93_005734 [Actinokineospora auranticolor]|uniref:Uncharacterized protein n=1 Tax=Actinokineospora auranticolor TaxID=155976 RepID=A0A2S6GJT8_9PSEU|nr:hypothetical protein [Actinokineospora auranticolor]PPK65487.1 hypothetical protein CLV40_114139 [Actinokineospora auranticolor]